MSARADLAVLIPAAGQGLRLGRGAKAELSVDGRPLLRWLVDKCLRVADEVLIAVPEPELSRFQQAYRECRCLPGGASRQDSVARLARASRHPWLLIQDVARPFVSVELLQAVAARARTSGCAGAFLDPEVPVARISDGRVSGWLPREQAGIFQAPQAFERELLLRLVNDAEASDRRVQSTMELALQAGCPVAVVAGEKTNIKITTEHDWSLVERLKDHLR